MPLASKIVVAAFHHTLGPIVEWAYPHVLNEERVQLPEEWTTLPFCALPDGSHAHDEVLFVFHLPPTKDNAWGSDSTMFAVACVRQLMTDELLEKPPDVTRQSVQKSVVLISAMPIFGLVRDKLAVVTAAYFEQRDFTNRQLLVDLFESLAPTVVHDYQFLVGYELRSFLGRFKTRALILFKLLLLQKKLLFYSLNVGLLSCTQYSLVSLVPNLILRLAGCGRGDLKFSPKDTRVCSEREDSLAEAGLPLELFAEKSVFQPYMPLQQTEHLSSLDSFMVGTSNAMIRERTFAILVDCDSAAIIDEPDLLSLADKKWMQQLMKECSINQDISEETESPDASDYEDIIRTQFENYLLSFLSAISKKSNPEEASKLDDYGPAFVSEFVSTSVYKKWIQKPKTLPNISHPCEGHGVLDEIDERRTQIQATIVSAMHSGGKMMSKVVKDSGVKASKAKEQMFSLFNNASTFIASKRAEFTRERKQSEVLYDIGDDESEYKRPLPKAPESK